MRCVFFFGGGGGRKPTRFFYYYLQIGQEMFSPYEPHPPHCEILQITHFFLDAVNLQLFVGLETKLCCLFGILKRFAFPPRWYQTHTPCAKKSLIWISWRYTREKRVSQVGCSAWLGSTRNSPFFLFIDGTSFLKLPVPAVWKFQNRNLQHHKCDRIGLIPQLHQLRWHRFLWTMFPPRWRPLK